MSTAKDDESHLEKEDDSPSLRRELRLIDDAPPFFTDKHIHYIATLAEKLERSYEGALTNHLKLSGVYWSVCSLMILCNNDLQQVDQYLGLVTRNVPNKLSIVEWIRGCFDDTTGAYGGDTGQDGHILYTLSALQILAMCDQLDQAPADKIVAFITSLQQPDGSFVGDAAGEVDTRFSYCALSALSIIKRLDAVNVNKAADYIMQCRNPVDGGFGSCIGAESHAGQVFCCIGALAIAQKLDPNVFKLSWWLSERQCDSGGLNGRSEKQADVCYSWWILSAMSILGVVHYIDGKRLGSFILKAQDPEDGGIADRPDDMADVFHSFFGISGLSLLNYLPLPEFAEIDPIYALPTKVVQKFGLQGQVVVAPNQRVEERLRHYTLLERSS
jgi:geranylgeranyl transferase type-2 subunit beta